MFTNRDPMRNLFEEETDTSDNIVKLNDSIICSPFMEVDTVSYILFFAVILFFQNTDS